jgi:hypothetical protein
VGAWLAGVLVAASFLGMTGVKTPLDVGLAHPNWERALVETDLICDPDIAKLGAARFTLNKAYVRIKRVPCSIKIGNSNQYCHIKECNRRCSNQSIWPVVDIGPPNTIRWDNMFHFFDASDTSKGPSESRHIGIHDNTVCCSLSEILDTIVPIESFILGNPLRNFHHVLRNVSTNIDYGPLVQYKVIGLLLDSGDCCIRGLNGWLNEQFGILGLGFESLNFITHSVVLGPHLPKFVGHRVVFVGSGIGETRQSSDGISEIGCIGGVQVSKERNDQCARTHKKGEPFAQREALKKVFGWFLVLISAIAGAVGAAWIVGSTSAVFELGRWGRLRAVLYGAIGIGIGVWIIFQWAAPLMR